MTGLRLCRDCCWRRQGFATAFSGEKCANQLASPVVVNLVTGSTKADWRYCSSARLSGEPCGPDGVLWAQRH
jgi:hypothetical protein